MALPQTGDVSGLDDLYFFAVDRGVFMVDLGTEFVLHLEELGDNIKR